MNVEFVDAKGALSDGLPICDVYLHPHYGLSAECIDGGTWECACDARKQIAFPYIRRPVHPADPNGPYDIISPYGYGGMSANATVDDNARSEFRRAFLNQSRERGLVAEFLRLNPLHEHRELTESAGAVQYRETFGSYVDDPEEEFAKTSGQHRTAVRKARRNGVAVREVPADILRDPHSAFRQIYDETMERVQSRDSLRLRTEYFEALCRLPSPCTRVLEAWHDDEAVGAAIFLVWGRNLHYHLSGSTLAGRRLQATDLIIDHAVRTLVDTPFRLHLGGGYTPEDSLSKFKRQASSASFRMPFTKLVVNHQVYEMLSAGIATSFFPAYRSPRDDNHE